MPINKELENDKTSTYKTKVIDSYIFMSSSLSDVVDNLAEVLRNYKCTDYKSCLECISIKDKSLIFECLICNKSNNKDFNIDLIKIFINTYEFCGGKIKKFILLLRKGIYPYDHTSTWIARKDLMKHYCLTNKILP